MNDSIQTFEIIGKFAWILIEIEGKKKGRRKKKKKNLIIEKKKERFDPGRGSNLSNLCLLNRITVWNKLPRQVCPRFSGLTTPPIKRFDQPIRCIGKRLRLINIKWNLMEEETSASKSPFKRAAPLSWFRSNNLG